MADFRLYEPTLKRWEGGFSNNPNDKGGATMMGVTLWTFRSYFGSTKTVDDLKKMTDAQWRYIMKKYWDKCQADKIENQSIAEILVDWHINSGTTAISTIQRAFGIKADGKVGPQTLGKLNGPDRKKVFDLIKCQRENYYKKLVDRTPSYSVFLKGWLNRVNSFHFSE